MTATASSSLAVTLASTTASICTISGNTLTPLAIGTCSIIATQAGNASYAAAAPVTRSFAVAGRPQTITFAGPGNQTMGTATPALSATSTSGLSVSFASSTTGICTVSGTTLTLVATGSCTITANQAGNTGYAAATAVSRTITVAAAPSSGASAADGRIVWNTASPASCASCHGPTANRTGVNGGSASKIISAIQSNKGNMGLFYTGNVYSGTSFTAQQIADMAAFLKAPY